MITHTRIIMTKMQLRPYQEKLVNEVRQHFGDGKKRVLMQSPTGSGKTVTFAHIVTSAVAKGKKVLVMAHRQELILQAHKTLWKYGVKAGVIMAGYDADPRASVQVASVQSLIRRLDQYKHFDLIVTDECHHATSATYLKIFANYPKAFVLGVTATPCRIDGKGLGDLFEVLVHGEQVQNLIDMGNLVLPKYITTPSPFNLEGIKITGGDYNKRQLSKAVIDAQIQGDLVNHWLEFAEGLQTIVFAVDCEHSRQIVNQYRQSGIKAEHIDANTPFAERSDIIKQFAAKKIQILSNVSIFTEGFDLPEIACVQIARPTKSLSLYFQMVGRALRPIEGKTEAIILDHAGVYHELGSVADPKIWELRETKPKEKRFRDAEQEERERNQIKFDVDTKLIMISEHTPSWIRFLNNLLIQYKEKGYQKGWVVFKFKEKYPDLTLKQYKTLARALDYHNKWAERQFYDLNARKHSEVTLRTHYGTE